MKKRIDENMKFQTISHWVTRHNFDIAVFNLEKELLSNIKDKEEKVNEFIELLGDHDIVRLEILFRIEAVTVIIKRRDKDE